MFRHYKTDIDYKKLIELQASQPAPFTSAKEIRKGSIKEAKKATSNKVKTLIKRRSR